MPIRRMALAGMLAAFGAGSWVMVERGPEAVAEVTTQTAKAVSTEAVKTETVKAIIPQKGLNPAEVDAILSVK